MVRIDQGPSGKGPRFPWDPRPERGPVDINDPLGNKRPERGKVNPLDPFGYRRERIVIDPTKLPKKLS